MFFRELTYNVVYSLYPCTLDDAVHLAAIHLQMAAGDQATKEDVRLAIKFCLSLFCSYFTLHHFSGSSSVEGCLQPQHLTGQAWSKTWEKKVRIVLQ